MKEFNMAKLVRAYKQYEDAKRYERSEEDIADKKGKLFVERFKLDEIIDNVEGRSTARLVSASMLLDEILYYERLIGISKKALEGTTGKINPHAQDFPRAYKYEPVSTVFYVRFSKGSWRITEICRERCDNKKISMKLSDSAKEAVISKYEVF